MVCFGFVVGLCCGEEIYFICVRSVSGVIYDFRTGCAHFPCGLYSLRVYLLLWLLRSFIYRDVLLVVSYPLPRAQDLMGQVPRWPLPLPRPLWFMLLCWGEGAGVWLRCVGGVIQLRSFGNGQRPVGWSMDLHPVQVRSFFRGTPAPFSAVIKVSAPIVCLHNLWLLGSWDGGSA